MTVEVENWRKSSFRKITFNDESCIPQDKSVPQQIKIHKKLIKQDESQINKPVNSNMTPFDSLSKHLQMSKLNPNSPEFKPDKKEKQEKYSEIQSEKSTSGVSNCSLAFMTAMTKNPVSVLYEFCQQRNMTCDFKILDIEGPPHKPRYSISVT